jgi:hypothetical protein
MTNQDGRYGSRRRALMCTGSAMTFGSIVASLLGDVPASHAAPAMGAIPGVDRVSVRVVRGPVSIRRSREHQDRHRRDPTLQLGAR